MILKSTKSNFNTQDMAKIISAIRLTEFQTSKTIYREQHRRDTLHVNGIFSDLN